MKEMVLKILSTVGITLLVVITFFLGQFPLIEGKNIINPYVDTQFSNKYSPEKFNEVKKGMTINQVIEIIGNPLGKRVNYNDSTNTDNYYTGDGKLLNSTPDSWKNGYDDFAWYRSTVTFDTNNIVVDIDFGWSYD